MSLTHWISVDDRVPAADEQVIFIDDDGQMYVGCRCDWRTCEKFHYNSPLSQDPNGLSNITHWMEPPDRPRINKNSI